jgi:hypothetical protein
MTIHSYQKQIVNNLNWQSWLTIELAVIAENKIKIVNYIYYELAVLNFLVDN